MNENNNILKVINIDDIRFIQQIYSKADRVFTLTFDGQGKQISDTTGDTKEFDYIKDNLKEEEFEFIKKTILKDVIVNKTEIYYKTKFDNLDFVAMPAMYTDEIVYIIMVILITKKEDYDKKEKLIKTNNLSFVNRIHDKEKVLGNARELNSKLIKNLIANKMLLSDIEKISENVKVVDDISKKNSILTSMINLLEEEKNFEDIMKMILKLLGEYLQVYNASLIKVNDKFETNLVVEWIKDNKVSLYSKLSKAKELSNILFDKEVFAYPLSQSKQEIYSPDNLLEELEMKSVATIPIIINNRPAMYILFFDDEEFVWNKSSLEFILDIRKVVQTILEKRISKNSLVSSYSALKEILDNIGSGLAVIDKNTKTILFSNKTLSHISKMELVGKKCNEFKYFCMDKNCENCEIDQADYCYMEKFDEEKQAWYEIVYNDITWVDGRIVSLCNITDVTEKKKYQKRIEFQANNDFLTGLYNRMRCEEDMAYNIEYSIREELKGAILFIDLDDFKHINDGLGHQYGDMLLKMISLGLQQINGIKDSCYRVGGDEFIIIVTPKHYERIQAILDDVKELFCKPWYLNENEYFCTMSMGIVTFPDEGRDVNDLIKKADIAMYNAKKSGKNRYEYYSESNDTGSVKRLDIEKNMRTAISFGCNEFELFIQPIINTATKECVGGEALIRWNNDNLGFLMPNEFVPIAEHLGLITPIGDYFLKKACNLNKSWENNGINKKINVNLSIVQLLQNNIVETIEEIIKETKINPANLVLEVTENLAINDMSRMKKIIKRIKKLGVKIALDDFGTGYSSLNYIKQMDLDIIKVDRTFIQDLSKDEYAKSFVKLITELSDSLDVEVCVEGVEDKEQYEILKELNVSMIQGYYFGKPLPIDVFEREYIYK